MQLVESVSVTSNRKSVDRVALLARIGRVVILSGEPHPLLPHRRELLLIGRVRINRQRESSRFIPCRTWRPCPILPFPASKASWRSLSTRTS